MIKINVLTNVISYDDYIDELFAKKIKAKNSGSFSQVFNHPTQKNLVVKVFTTYDDKGYEAWLKFVMENQKNLNVPKLHSVTKCIAAKEGRYKPEVYYVVIMEKLQVCNFKQFEKFFLTHFPDMKEKYLLETGHMRDWSKEAYIQGYFKKKNVIQKYTKHKNKNFANIFTFLTNFKANNVDIHDCNIMKRDDEFVFTDPLAVWK